MTVFELIPWGALLELAVLLVAVGAAWGSNRSQLNGLGQRVNDLHDQVEKNEGMAEVTAGLSTALSGIDRRLERIEKLLDSRVNLGA